MKHRTFGRSGIQVSEIIFGAGAVGGILIHHDDATKREAIRRAFAGGINWIDTAAQYGSGKSEAARLASARAVRAWRCPECRRKFNSTSRICMTFLRGREIPDARLPCSALVSRPPALPTAFGVAGRRR